MIAYRSGRSGYNWYTNCYKCLGGVPLAEEDGHDRRMVGWRGGRCVLELPTGDRTKCHKQGRGGTTSSGAEVPTGVYGGAAKRTGVCTLVR